MAALAHQALWEGEKVKTAPLPSYVRKKVAKGHTYYYYDTGKLDGSGRRILTPLPSLNAPNFARELAKAALVRWRADAATVPSLRCRSEPGFGEFNPSMLDGEIGGDDLYFIRAANAVKIGRAKCVWSRLGNMQANNPVELECIGRLLGRGFEERAWQAYFQDYWIRGEWFEWTFQLADAIDLASENKQWWSDPPRQERHPAQTPGGSQ